MVSLNSFAYFLYEILPAIFYLYKL